MKTFRNYFVGFFLLFLSTISTNLLAQTYVMNSAANNTTVNTCRGLIVDNGGLNGTYANNSDYTVTYCSSDGTPLRINVFFLDVESNYDYLYIHDGPNTGSPLLATLTGYGLVNDNPSWVYTSTGTCITIRFTSDGSTRWDGWEIGVACAPSDCNGNTPASDFCGAATPICSLNSGYCGSTSGWYTIDAQNTDNYVGNGQFCGSIENNSWLSFTADATSVTLNTTVGNCTTNNGVQMVLFQGNCGGLTRVGSNCVSPIIGNNQFTFNGLTPGNNYYLMVDGYAGDICDYTITAVSGVEVIEIADLKGNTTSGEYCEGECGTFSISSTNPPSGYNWYSVPAGVSGTGATLNYCPTTDMTIYCDVTGACGTTTTVEFDIDVTSITFTGLPLTMTCSDAPVNLQAPAEITPCVVVEFNAHNQTSPAMTVGLLEGGASFWPTSTATPGANNSITYYGLSPSEAHSLQFTGNTGSDISFTVKDCSDGSLIYSGLWTSANGTVAISGAGSPPKGIANYTTSCGGGITSTDYGTAVFDPSDVTGPFPKNCSVTYNWDNQNGCNGSGSQNITITNSNSAAWNAPDSICASAGSISLTPLITGTTGGTWNGTGVSGNTFNPSGLSGLIPIKYSVGTAPCIDSVIHSIFVNPDVNPSWTPPSSICESATSINLDSFVTGTPGGSWSGSGVSGNMFDPSGLSGSISIEYTVGTPPCEESSVRNITVNPDNTVTPASSSPTVCINTAITPSITHTTTGATGIGTATNLPTGVTASFGSNTITISGTPTASGTFNYTIPLTGGCGAVNATGTITVNPNNTVTPASSSPTVCINTAITPSITHTTTGATGIGVANGLPAGVSASFGSNTITISGTPTASGTFSYSIPLTGGCGTVNATGTITVNPDPTVGINSASECENIPGSGDALNIDVTTLNSSINATGNITWFTDNTYGTSYSPVNETVSNGEVFYFEVEINGCVVQDSIIYNVGSNIVLTDPLPEFCEDALGSGSVSGVDLNTFNNAVYSGATTYTWAVGPTGVTINDGDSINIEVKDGNCPTVDIFVHFTVNPLPTATMSGGDTICVGDAIPDVTISLTGTSPWTVTYTDGTTPVTINPATSPVTLNGLADGTYTITSVSDANCTGTFSGSATILTNPLPTATISGGGTICAGDTIPDVSIALTGASPWTITYTDGTSPVTINSTTSPVILSGLADGTYTITSVSDTNCTGTFSGSATILTNPLPTAIDQTPQVCEDIIGSGTAQIDLTTYDSLIDGGTGTTISWFNDSALTTAVANPTSTVVSNGQVFYAETDNGTCTNTSTVTFTINSIDTTNSNASICQGDSLFVGGNWQTVAGIYYDTTTNISGCDSILITNLTIDPKPIVQAMNDTTICSGSLLSLTATTNGSGTIKWYSDAALTNLIGNGSPLTIPSPNNGTNTFYVIENGGVCPSNIDSVNVTISEVIANINANPTSGVIPLDVNFDGTGSTGNITSYDWNFGNSNNSNLPITNNVYNDIGTYVVTLIVSDGFCSDTTTITIETFGLSSMLIPNVFTPNGDGNNDFFKVDGVNLKNIEGEIYNRWGQKVFAWDNVNGMWDGKTLAGADATDGTYFYIIRAEGLDGKEYFQKGTLTLLR